MRTTYGYALLTVTITVLALVPQLSADGRLRMCPPGGSSFTMAWSMACTMRKKRDTSEQRNVDTAKRALIAPSIRQLQTICCDVGCSVNDLLSYCGPLTGW
uniref:Relaxin-like factor n=1 Tax=Haemonchus contortus TaxID=6289 RepID=A0A7I4Z6Z0_HAECO